MRIALERQGTPIGALDTLIAAPVLAVGCVPVTRHVLEFRRVPALALDNWVRP